MSSPFLLQHLLTESARRFPNRPAVRHGNRELSYRELDALSTKLANSLRSHELRRGARVGIYVPKSLASFVSIYGVLKAGGCYVPLDPEAPPDRLALIARDSGIAFLLSSTAKTSDIDALLERESPIERLFLVDCDELLDSTKLWDARNHRIGAVSWPEIVSTTNSPIEEISIEEDIAYILYTSGSTGSPKGVMITHRNSLAFDLWAAECVSLTENDVVACHAPLHFDISTFSIFSSCLAGSMTILIPEGISIFPVKLTELMERERITVWYSVPSLLTLMTLYGNLPSRNLGSLRVVIFAGEVFPVKFLRQMMLMLPQARFLNWYGPTETNVCTWYQVESLDEGRITPVPIGKSCANTEVFAIDDSGRRVEKPGIEGELLVRGPTVMKGYWGDPERSAKVLVRNPFNQYFNETVYMTGDIVTLDDKGNYNYAGRRDGMIKTRGYRVELGEIESVILGHEAVSEAAVTPVPDELIGNRLRAFISLREGSNATKEEVLSFCTGKLPRYMIPESFEFLEALPKTSTGKTDRIRLAQRAIEGERS